MRDRSPAIRNGATVDDRRLPVSQADRMTVFGAAGISTDVGSVPLFWTIPLAVYLLTFVIVFQQRPIIPHWLVVAVQPVFVLFLVFALLFG